VVADNQRSAQRTQRLASLGKLAAGIAHEINTPVQYVNDSVSFLESSFDDLLKYCVALDSILVELAESTGHKEALKRAEEARCESDFEYVRENAGPAIERSLEGLALVADIAQAMKRIAYEDPRRRSPTDINELFEDTLLIAAAEYRFVAEVERQFVDIPRVNCDRSAMGQVFLNLVINAADAIRERDDSGQGLITVRSEVVDSKVHISISDSGMGIPEELREKVFEAFFTTKQIGKGSGQGLAMVARVVSEHGGTVHIESEVGVGTTFTIVLSALELP